MRIIIDGDSCSTLAIIAKVATEKQIPIMVYCDYNHNIDALGYATINYNDSGTNQTDYVIFSELRKDDILITNDVGLAGIALLKCGSVITNEGKIYNDCNVDCALYIRGERQRARHKRKSLKLQRTIEHFDFESSLLKEINRLEE